MATDESPDADVLRQWIEHVERPETVQWLMIAIAHEEGVPVGDLARWYDVPADQVRDWMAEVRSESLVVSIAEREGLDFEALGMAAGLGRQTVVDWIRALESRPIEEAADIVHRYSTRSAGPLLSGTKSRVQYLNYQTVQERGWSIDDDDLFAKASDAHLDATQYGRFVVDPGETILEAAEHRNIDWPYACRGGACANCAVIIKEGDVAMPGQTVLSDEQVQDMNARLTCVGVPVTEDVKLVMNVQHLDQFEDLRLPSPVAGTEPSL